MNISLKKKAVPFEILIFLIVLFFLLLWFGYSFTLHLISPPSNEMSREKVISNLDYGFSRTLNYHVIVLQHRKDETATILAVDGKELQFIDIDILGRTRQWKTIDLDLSQASRMSGYYVDSDTIRLFYLTTSFYQTDVRIDSGSCTTRELEKDVLDFRSSGLFAAVLKKNGDLRLINTAGKTDQILSAPGEIQSFSIGLFGDNVEILTVYKKNWETSGLSLNQIDPVSGRQNATVLMETVPSKYFKDLTDTRISGESLTALYKYRDRRYGVNRMTIQKIDLLNKKIVSEYKCSVPLFNSSYTLIESSPGTTRFIHQFESINGVNLTIAHIDEDGNYTDIPITKTKSMSKLGGFFETGEYEGLIFSDINFDQRVLLFASNHPDVMREQSRFSSIPFWYPAGTTLLLFLVSAVAGGLYLLGQIPVPVAAAYLVDRLTGAIHKPLYFAKCSFIAVIHAVIKLLISHVILTGNNFRFKPLLFGSSPQIYIILVLSTVIAFILSLRMNRQQKTNLNGTMSFYYRFSTMDFLLYVPLVIMYVTSSILLSKI